MAPQAGNYKISRSLRNSDLPFLSSSAKTARRSSFQRHCNFKSKGNSFVNSLILLSSSQYQSTNILRLIHLTPPHTLNHTIPSHLITSHLTTQQPPTTSTMVRTRRQNPNGNQSPLESMSNTRVSRPRPTPSPPPSLVYPPGLEFFYNENIGLFDDDVSTLDLDGSVRSPSPSGAMAALRSPSVASDGMVHIGDEGDDESQISEPADDIRLSDDEGEDENTAIIIPDDVRTVISISSDEESHSDDDISDLDLASGGDENENENEDEEEEEPQVHQLYGHLRIRQPVLDRHREEDANRPTPPPFSMSCSSSPSTNHTNSPNRTITASPSPNRNISLDRTVSAPPSPNRTISPDRTISDPPSPDHTVSVPSTPNRQDDGPAADPDQTMSEPSSLHLAREDNNQEDEEMGDDGIVEYQGLPPEPYINRAPSHFVRSYRGITTIWSVLEWERDGPAILAEEAAQRERERDCAEDVWPTMVEEADWRDSGPGDSASRVQLLVRE